MRITTWVFRRENKSLLTASTINNAVLPLNRYGFFRFLNEKLIPNGKISIDVTLETDNNVIFRANEVDPRRYVVTRMVLWVPKVIFNTEGETMLLETFSKPHTWSYLRERIVVSPSSTSRQQTFKIDSNIRKPRHVFVLVLNETKLNDQEQNMFLFNTYNIANNRTITSCQLELSNGVYYPQERLEPTTQLAKTYRTLLGYNQGFFSHVTSPSPIRKRKWLENRFDKDWLPLYTIKYSECSTSNLHPPFVWRRSFCKCCKRKGRSSGLKVIQ